jgi:phospholipase A1
MTMDKPPLIIIVSMLFFSVFAFANEEELKECIENEIYNGDQTQTIEQVRTKCRQILENNETAIERRIARERISESNPNVITPHKRNYILPYTVMDRPKNTPAEQDQNLQGGRLDAEEAKFQLSLKVPLYESQSDQDSGLYFGFTLQSYWQLFNSEISSPFRETNYQPELFWMNVLDKENRLWGDEMGITFGFEHQSNGRNIPLSRSWNRLYMNLFWEQNGFVFNLRPWYRIPEEEKTSLSDTKGDDNPDIADYMGHFEFTTVYTKRDHEFSLMLRNNLKSDNKGAVQLDWSFPAWGRLRGYAQYFNGYGESLVDYNQHVERFGVGILLTDFL